MTKWLKIPFTKKYIALVGIGGLNCNFDQHQNESLSNISTISRWNTDKPYINDYTIAF